MQNKANLSTIGAKRKLASKALSNARQRCDNENDPNYPHYGAKGIKALFKSVDDLISCIGLPGKGMTLDRIDPHGNYEPGNIRWASKAVQAINKKASAANFHLSDAAQIAEAKAAISQKENRKAVASAWKTLGAAFHRGYLLESEASFLNENLSCSGSLEASHDLNTVMDYANHEPGFMHLPALSMPDCRVRIRCEVVDHPEKASALEDRGRFAALERLDHEWNVTPALWKMAVNMVQMKAPGLLLTGRPTEIDLLGGWIEGNLVALASALAAKNVSTAFFPMMTAAGLLAEMGPPSHWDDWSSPILDAEVIMVPDFVLDCGSWGDFPANRWWKFNDLISYRMESHRSTVLGVQNISKVPSNLKEAILGHFHHFKMSTCEPHEAAPLKFSAAHWKIPEGTFNFAKMKSSKRGKHLVQHCGLIGT